MRFDIEKEPINDDPVVNVKVLGVGGGGGNAINTMVKKGIQDVEFIAINTDIASLRKSNAHKTVQIGKKLTNGRGAGANPDIGQKSAEENIEEIETLLQDTQMVFVATGMGGGTGTGATPIVAKVAKDMGILTVGIVTKPFNFEGKKKMAQAEQGIEALAQNVDALIVIPNERLRSISDTPITLTNAFMIADEVLCQGVKCVTDLILTVGTMNVDFADVTTVMKDSGRAHMGVGSATGKDKATVATNEAMTSPLLESTIDGANGVLINFTVSPNVTMEEVGDAAELITSKASPSATIIWGFTVDEELEDEIVVTVIATGFDTVAEPAEEEAAEAAKGEKVEDINAEDEFINLLNFVNGDK